MATRSNPEARVATLSQRGDISEVARRLLRVESHVVPPGPGVSVRSRERRVHGPSSRSARRRAAHRHARRRRSRTGRREARGDLQGSGRVQEPEVQAGRSGGRGTRVARGRRAGEPPRLLRRHRLGRRLDLGRRRRHVEADLRRSAGLVHRLDRRRPVQSRRHLCRRGRGQHPGKRRRGPRDLQVDRRREDLDARLDAGGADRNRDRPSREPRPRLRRRPRPRLRAQPGARRLPHAGRRPDLATGPQEGRRHGRLRRLLRPFEPQHPVRRTLAGAPSAVGDDERRAGERSLPVARRRRHLGAAHRARPPGGHLGEGRRGGGALRRPARLRADRGGEGGTLPLGRRWRHLDPGQRSPRPAPAPLVLFDAHGRPDERRRRLVPAGADAPHHRWRPDHQAGEEGPPRGPPRPLDRPEEPEADDRSERRGRGPVVERRGDLARAAAPARAVLSRGRGRRGPLSRLGGDAGSRDRLGAERQPRLRRHHAGRLVRRRGRRGGIHRARSDRPEHRLRRRVFRHHHPLRSPHGDGTQRVDLPRELLRPRRRGQPLPLPVDGAHRPLAARFQGCLPRRQRAVPHRGRGPDLEGDQPRPHAQRPIEAEMVRRPDHRRQHRGRVVRHDLRRRRVAQGEGSSLGRHRRRPGADDARRRCPLDERHGEHQGDPGVGHREPRRALPLRRRHRLRRRGRPPARRRAAVPLEDDRLRQNLEEPGGEAPSGRLPARRARGSETAGPPLSRHGEGRVVLARRRGHLAGARPEPADRRRARSRHQVASGRRPSPTSRSISSPRDPRSAGSAAPRSTTTGPERIRPRARCFTTPCARRPKA